MLTLVTTRNLKLTLGNTLMESHFLENQLVVTQMAVSSPISLVCPFLSLSLSDDLLFFFFLIFSSLFGIIDLLFIVYCHKWWVPTSLLACTNTMPLFFVIYNTDVCVWFSLSPVNFALLDQFFKIFFLFTFYLVRSLASYNSYDKLQSSFAHSLLSSPPIYLSLLFSHGSNAEPFLWKKKKNVESHCWDVARDSWRCESHTNTKTTMKYIWISLSKKKKKFLHKP